MAAFFGIDEFKAQGFIDRSVVCIPHDGDGRPDLHAIVAPIKNEDIVFIKQCTPQLELHIKAIGIVQSDYPTESILGMCLPVNWVWQGEKVPVNVDESSSLCGAALYEEHSISVQKEIIDLLPEKHRMPQEW
ncbi:hypothetical protein [Sideroxydans lithotrophicus]|uniref:Uncharacterized protein n=1 Tax=Sideroxydans lithotrophicus (strain ES-1) TaxID=580332 RepID=D5CRK5_SIDLE|nr:hypothetical protein [Sideroxydans lithotrophicus]ADE11591.1 hypothetical protein Slit_1354 [Sideroxydans lithotrophicus ES-1]